MQSGQLSGLNWLIAGGIGSYLGYIGYSTIMWERLIANLQFSGTAVFAIYVSDSAGYTVLLTSDCEGPFCRRRIAPRLLCRHELRLWCRGARRLYLRSCFLYIPQ